MRLIKDNILFWYKNNLGKIVFLLATTVVLTLVVTYVPYLNIIIPVSVGFLISFIIWYILFSPSESLLILFSIVLLTASAVMVIMGLDFLSESLGQIIYLLLILILINDIKEFYKKRQNPQ